MVSRKARRIIALSEALDEHRVLHLNDAARILDVSLMTVRRDVAESPEKFAYLGGHIVHAASIEGDGPYELVRASDNHAVAKKTACSHAIKYMNADETVFFDCGTTLIPLIGMIPDSLSITAVCYAMNMAEKLAQKPNVRLVMLGGIYHSSSGSFASAGDNETLKHLGINTAFLTAAGVDFKRGATCENFHEAPIKSQVIARAQRCVLVTDNSKIGKVKSAHFSDVSAFQPIITEDGELDIPVECPVEMS